MLSLAIDTSAGDYSAELCANTQLLSPKRDLQQKKKKSLRRLAADMLLASLWMDDNAKDCGLMYSRYG